MLGGCGEQCTDRLRIIEREELKVGEEEEEEEEEEALTLEVK